MFFNAVVLAALATSALATPISNKRVVHEKREIINTVKGDRVDADAIIPIRIGLKQSNLEHGYDVVMDVSDQRSPNYGKHWSLEQVREFFAPPDESMQAVKAWLIDFGIDPELIGESADRGWVGINIPTKQAEELLGAEYYEHHGYGSKPRIGCDEYSLPAHISDVVDFIKPGVVFSPPMEKKSLAPRDTTADFGNVPYQFPVSNRPRKRPNPQRPTHWPPGAGSLPEDLRYCGTNITPACQRALYNIPLGKYNTAANTLGVAEFDESYSQSDLNEFFNAYAKDVPQGTGPKVYSIIGGAGSEPPAQAGDEADIDFDITISLVYPQKTAEYSVGDFTGAGYTNKQGEDITFVTPLLDAIDGSFCTAADRKNGLQCGTVPVPRVLSISYGSPELFNYQIGVERSCSEFMKLVLQGSTVIVSSGDWGVASAPTTTYNGCVNKDYVYLQNGTIFSPSFPADCPYVLAAGATQLYGNESVNDPEYVMNIPMFAEGGATFSSSGGFSNYFSRPSYQDDQVNAYLSKYVPDYKYYSYNGNDIFSGKSNVGANGGVYNRPGRALPDVSANGANYTAYYNSTLYDFFGTSLAAPIWASVITLINEERTQAGKSPVGFVNPTLYQNPSAFHDITHGTNPGCGTNGFAAVPGWDPSSGLGTPNYPALLDLFMGSGYSGGHGYDTSSKS